MHCGEEGQALNTMDKKREGRLSVTVPLISVIVPVYNVEKYLKKCLDSLRSQTMKEIEVIAIDDGSTDDSGSIVDDFASAPGIWPRFRVIHNHENLGLSATRNLGIDEAKSSWIMFVDGDDYVDPQFCKIPYEAAIENDADLVIFRYCEVKQGRIQQRRQHSPTGLVDTELATEYGTTVAWNKLYKRNLFSAIRYPVGRVYEDIAITHKIVFSAMHILMLKDTLYYHIIRDDSISQLHLETYKRDGFEFAFQRYNDLISYGLPSNKHETMLYSYALSFLAVAKPSKNKLYQKAVEVCNSIKGIPYALTFKKKIMLGAWKINKKMFYFICRIMKQNMAKI